MPIRSLLYQLYMTIDTYYYRSKYMHTVYTTSETYYYMSEYMHTYCYKSIHAGLNIGLNTCRNT